MSSPFDIFRKHQKLLLAVFGVMLMVVFTVGYSLSQMASEGEGGGGAQNAVAVKWTDGQLTQGQLEGVRSLRMYLSGFLVRVHQEALGKGAFAEQQQQRMQAWQNGDFSFRLPYAPIFEPGDASNEGTVRRMVLANRARQQGFVVTDDQIWKYLDGLVDKKTSRKELAGLIKGKGYSISDAFDALRDQMLATDYIEQFSRAASVVPPAQQFEYYKRFNREVTIEALAIPVDQFIDKVGDPSESELNAYFEKHKTILQPFDYVAGDELLSPNPGFKLPDRVAVEYVNGSPNEFIDAVADDVTEAEIAAYYEENKLRDEELRIQDVDSDDGLPSIDDLEIDTTNKPADDKPADDKAPDDTPPAKNDNIGKSEDKPAGDDGAAVELDSKTVFTLLEDEATAPAAEENTDTPKPETTKPDGGAKNAVNADDAASEAPSDDATADDNNQPAGDGKKDEPAPSDTKTPDDGKTEKSVGDKPKDAAKDKEKPKEPEFKFKPLDEVRDYIRGRLTESKAEERLRKNIRIVHARMASYHKARIKADEGQDPSQPKPDLKTLAEEYSLEYHVTALTSLRDFIDASDIGKSYDPPKAVGGRNVPFAQLAFEMGNESLFIPHPTQDDDDNHYVFWLLDEAKAEVGELTGTLREQVIKSWKLGAGLEDETNKARGLARKQAEQLAERIRNGEATGDLAKEQPGSEIISTPPFAWLRRSFVGFQMSAAVNSVIGIDQPGPDFMEAVFALAPNEVTVAVNYPRSHVYVIRLLNENKSAEVLQQEFLDGQQSPFPKMQIDAAQRFESQIAVQHWIRGLERELQLEWVQPELRFE
jgi:hypothetical protein